MTATIIATAIVIVNLFEDSLYQTGYLTGY